MVYKWARFYYFMNHVCLQIAIDICTLGEFQEMYEEEWA